MKDEAEQLEFVGVERRADGVLVARLRNIDHVGLEWLADRALLELRMSTKIPFEPRAATLAALGAVLMAESAQADGDKS